MSAAPAPQPHPQPTADKSVFMETSFGSVLAATLVFWVDNIVISRRIQFLKSANKSVLGLLPSTYSCNVSPLTTVGGDGKRKFQTCIVQQDCIIAKESIEREEIIGHKTADIIIPKGATLTLIDGKLKCPTSILVCACGKNIPSTCDTSPLRPHSTPTMMSGTLFCGCCIVRAVPLSAFHASLLSDL